MKKILRLIAIITALSLSLSSISFARGGYTGGGNTGNTGNQVAVSNRNEAASMLAYTSNQGMRYTIVDENGDRVGQSLDIVNYDPRKLYKNGGGFDSNDINTHDTYDKFFNIHLKQFINIYHATTKGQVLVTGESKAGNGWVWLTGYKTNPSGESVGFLNFPSEIRLVTMKKAREYSVERVGYKLLKLSRGSVQPFDGEKFSKYFLYGGDAEAEKKSEPVNFKKFINTEYFWGALDGSDASKNWEVFESNKYSLIVEPIFWMVGTGDAGTIPKVLYGTPTDYGYYINRYYKSIGRNTRGGFGHSMMHGKWSIEGFNIVDDQVFNGKTIKGFDINTVGKVGGAYYPKSMYKDWLYGWGAHIYKPLSDFAFTWKDDGDISADRPKPIVITQKGQLDIIQIYTRVNASGVKEIFRKNVNLQVANSISIVDEENDTLKKKNVVKRWFIGDSKGRPITLEEKNNLNVGYIDYQGRYHKPSGVGYKTEGNKAEKVNVSSII